MLKVRKNVLSVLILMLAATLVFTACSGNNAKEGSNTSTNKPAEATNAPEATEPAKEPATDLKPYTIKLVYTGLPQKDEAKIEEAASKYLTEKINAKLDIIAIDWGPWEDKLNMMIASREKVDVIFTAQWQKYAINVEKGAFKDLADLLQTPAGQAVVSGLDPAYIEGSKINGKNYAIPTNKELAAQGGIVYRKDVAEELGIDMSQVKTIADLDAVFATVKEKKPGMTPIYFKEGETFNSHYIGNYDALGDTSIPGLILKDADDTKVVPNYDLPRYVDTLKLTRDFFKKGYINSDAATNQTSTNDAIKSGNYFAVPNSLKPGKAAEMENQLGMTGKLAQVALNEKTTATSETAGAMLAISTTSEDPERAMMFISLLHTDKVLNNLINFGIEGDHYDKVSDEIIKPAANAASYAPGAAWMLGNQFLNYVWESEAPDKWAQFAEFNKGSKVSKGLGFVFNSEPVKAEVAAIVNVDAEYLTALETGSVDVDKVLPEYSSKLKAAGIDKIITEKQTQFDAFLAGK
ncbi:ABC transporter substrate-binding protein [Paenibacillus sp. 2TAB19]|jgi:putative aldouronate transport system substrate-binding protein|uniref:ABC transporter substrate-binding protein n=1 Tax=Paenibacillus sp. 2TAB19 TaxID=3233003 RepID=UPI003F9E9188